MTHKTRMGITLGSAVFGAAAGWILSNNALTSKRERVLSTALAATAAMGAAHTVLTLVSIEENANGQLSTRAQ